MTEYDFQSIETRIDVASKVLSLAFKVGVLIGGLCLLFYCYRLDYFPVGMSVGDQVLLIMLAMSFGIVYSFFVASLTALGLWLTPILRPIQKFGFWVRQRLKKRPPNDPLQLVSPDLNAFIFGFFGIVFIAMFSQIESRSIWTLPATSFLLALIFASYRQTSLKLAGVLKGEEATIESAGPPSSYLDKERLRMGRTLSLALLFTTPLLVGGVSGIVLEGGMRFANIKKGPSYVLLRAPYSAFVPLQFQSKQAPSVPEYTSFEDVDVKFSGLGQRTLIEFKEDNKAHRLEVPNESILVIPREPTQTRR